MPASHPALARPCRSRQRGRPDWQCAGPTAALRAPPDRARRLAARNPAPARESSRDAPPRAAGDASGAGQDRTRRTCGNARTRFGRLERGTFDSLVPMGRLSRPRQGAANPLYLFPVPLSETSPHAVAGSVVLPDAPALVAGFAQAAWLTPDGEVETVTLAEAARRAKANPPFLCHARATARRLGTSSFAALDLLELFAFVYPAKFCLPTPRGLAAALGLAAPKGIEAEALTLIDAARALLARLNAASDNEARAIAAAMAKGGWGWGPAVLAALPEGDPGRPGNGLAQWRKLTDWQDHAPELTPGNFPVEESEARSRLAELLGANAEPRPQQSDYAAAVSAAFRPRDLPEAPRLVLAEAGTGVGKTLG